MWSAEPWASTIRLSPLSTSRLIGRHRTPTPPLSVTWQRYWLQKGLAVAVAVAVAVATVTATEGRERLTRLHLAADACRPNAMHRHTHPCVYTLTSSHIYVYKYVLAPGALLKAIRGSITALVFQGPETQLHVQRGLGSPEHARGLHAISGKGAQSFSCRSGERLVLSVRNHASTFSTRPE